MSSLTYSTFVLTALQACGYMKLTAGVMETWSGIEQRHTILLKSPY